MRPLLKSYVSFSPAADGVYFQAGQRSFMLKGKGLFRLVSRMLATFDGKRPLAIIEAGVPDKVRPIFNLLVGELTRHDMLQLVNDETSPPLSATLSELYGSTLAFLQDETPAFAAYFRQWRETPFAVVGAGFGFRALARGLAKSGVRRLRLVPEESGSEEQDRSALQAAFAAHVAVDVAFEHEWSDRHTFAAMATETGLRVLYVCDRIPEDCDSALLRQIARRGGPHCFVGGVYRGHGLVGPQSDDARGSTIQLWRKLLPEGDAAPYSSSTCSIIGALMALEALKFDLYAMRAEPGSSDWPQRHFFHVTASGEVTTHVLQPTAAVPEASAAIVVATHPETDWTVAGRRRLESGMAAAFDPLTGVLQWSDEAGREFPLPHQSIVLRLAQDGGEPIFSPVRQWALTPQEAGLRTLYKASARYVEVASDDRRPRPSITAAASEELWRPAALAGAVVRSSLFAERGRSSLVSPHEIDDPNFQMLMRLGRLYSDALPVLCLTWVPGLPAFLAETAIGPVRSRAVAACALDALVESLGESLSKWQRADETQNAPEGDDSLWQDVVVPLPEGDAMALSQFELAEASLESFGYSALSHVADCGIFDGSGVHFGWMTAGRSPQ